MRSPLVRAGIAACIATLGYSFIDALADFSGDGVQWLQAAMGLEYAVEADVPGNAAAMDVGWINVVDDLVEDTFKAACVYTHLKVGAVVGAVFLPPLPQVARGSMVLDGARGAARLVITLGPSAEHYSACDRYGDWLGDHMQRWVKNVR